MNHQPPNDAPETDAKADPHPAQPQRYIGWLIDIRREEWVSVGYSFGWFLFLMMAYNLLRPIRETFASSMGKTSTGRMFLYTFLVLLIAVPIFAWVKNNFPKRFLVPGVFHFFASHLAIFALLSFNYPAADWVGVIFFVWLSVFIIFVVSLLWSLLADIFDAEQAKRLFGPIASGATIGSLVGSAIASQLGSFIGTAALFACAFLFLEIAVVFATLLLREARKNRSLQTPDSNAAIAAKSDSGFAELISGLTKIAGSRYLQMICLYIVLSQLFGTFVYFLLTETVAAQILNPTDRLSHFAKINFAAQLGTLAMQTLIVSRVVKFLGVSVALTIGPVVSLSCVIGILISPTLLLISVVDVVNRLAGYGLTVPAKEMLFSVVDEESKYKSKSFIDTVVTRGSDALAGSLPLKAGHVIPLTMLCGGVGWMLGIRRAQQASRQQR
jgi:AAA family ATP:ADP antiporter